MIGDPLVIPAKAGTSGRKGSAGLPEVPAYAGMTGLLFPSRPSQSRIASSL